MTNKVLMAEGLDFIREAEAREYELDKKLDKMKDLKKIKGEIAKLVRDYEIVYRLYIKGLEVLNYVRHNASDTSADAAAQNRQVTEFCAAKMMMYMDRCAGISKKLSGVFVPIEEMSIPMEGFCAGKEVIGVSELVLNAKSSKFAETVVVERGTYVLTVKNNDDYTFAAPDVVVEVKVTPSNPAFVQLESGKVKVEVPCTMGWRHVIGTSGATVEVRITADGKRDAHLSVYLNQWVSDASHITTTNSASPGSRAAQPARQPSRGAAMMVRPVPVRPSGMTCRERLDVLTLATDSWQTENVPAVRLPGTQQNFLQAVFALPLPSDLG